ncbi:uncharacterized protein LOC117653638 [Thrips palmi]|uniref:Uncharacterized protein LOC117653638 n=1 Tax=Thrips palmi TaxID=161013 RepID=A0A6P9ADE7_THRPL|nr:uncharacterized protein LOC117653638 [Thrips palmi]
MDGLHDLFAQTIKRALPRLTDADDDINNIVDNLVNTVGINTLELTVHVREEDFTNIVLPVEARILKAAFAVLNVTGRDRQDDDNGGADRVNRDLNAEANANAGDAQGRRPRRRNHNFVIDWRDIYNIDDKIKTRLQRGKKIRKKQRKSLVSRIVTQVRNRVPHATRQTFVDVMEDMKAKYEGSFKHELANGAVGKTSITASMQSKFDNDRRPPPRTKTETEAPNIKAAYGCRKWRVSRLPDGETPDTQEEKRMELVRIFTTERPRAWNWENINNLIDDTYATQRMEINRQAELIEKDKKARAKAKRLGKEYESVVNGDDPAYTTASLRDRWPFLFTANGMKHHFDFLTSNHMDAQIANFVEEKLDDMLEFLMEKKGARTKK